MDLLAGKMLGFMLVLTRIGAFFAAVPVFSWTAIPTKIKLTIAIFIAIFFSNTTGCVIRSEETFVLEAAILMANEAIYGLALGFTAAFIFASVKLAARIAERQMGLSMASIPDPLSGDSGQILGVMMEMIFILLFLSANGHHLFLMTVCKSYETFPVGSIPAIETLTESVISTTSIMLLLGLKMCAPILGAFLLMMVVMAILARIVPETNILFLALPMRVGLGLLMVGIFFPFINNFVKDFAQLMDKFIPL